MLLLLLLWFSSSSASPWVWDCNETLGTCSRVLPTQVGHRDKTIVFINNFVYLQTTNPLDFMECKMTCSGEGTLWPLPSGAFSLSSELASFFAESSVQITLLDASQDVI